MASRFNHWGAKEDTSVIVLPDYPSHAALRVDIVAGVGLRSLARYGNKFVEETVWLFPFIIDLVHPNAGITSLANNFIDCITFSWGRSPKKKLHTK